MRQGQNSSFFFKAPIECHPTHLLTCGVCRPSLLFNFSSSATQVFSLPILIFLVSQKSVVTPHKLVWFHFSVERGRNIKYFYHDFVFGFFSFVSPDVVAWLLFLCTILRWLFTAHLDMMILHIQYGYTINIFKSVQFLLGILYHLLG